MAWRHDGSAGEGAPPAKSDPIPSSPPHPLPWLACSTDWRSEGPAPLLPEWIMERANWRRWDTRAMEGAALDMRSNRSIASLALRSRCLCSV